ncbi:MULTISPECIES: TatD family nuclease-associated radical SAM protein [unclassified Neptuniibacter]|uniref:TatD family nuclease-associated radical SAM protein n=1 Tax=unclassified Neptuniibacter TaxID=2630693 RepID=UPI0025F55C24|nr:MULTISPECIES: TatD family nuclease-associated radical SAM protein [unclassified Neptuniibacter]
MSHIPVKTAKPVNIATTQRPSSSKRLCSAKRPNPAKRMTAADHQDSVIYQIRNSLYINLTDRCTLACQFCPKHNGSTEVKGHELYLSKRPEVSSIISQLGDPSRYDEVVFCGYGEPTLRLKALLEIAHWVKQHGGKTRINTDGLGNLFHKRDIVPELAECIDALSISLNAQNETVYKQHCLPALPGSYEAVQAFIKRAAALIPDVQVSAINGLEGVDVVECREMSERLGAEFKQRELDVVG